MQIVLCFANLLVVAFAEIQLSPVEEERARLALENPDLFEGDIAGVEYDADRNAIIGEHLRWPEAKVYYVIDQSVAYGINIIMNGIKDYHKNTCVKLIERTNEPNYVKILNGTGCHSRVGMQTGEQIISLGTGCMYLGTVVHEFGHALGFYHEQSRSDRDDYLIIYLENVKDDMYHNFKKYQPYENILYNTFDYDSIMIYGNKSFSKNGQFTIAAKNGHKLTDPYYKQGMSPSDIERVNKMYNC